VSYPGPLCWYFVEN